MAKTSRSSSQARPRRRRTQEERRAETSSRLLDAAITLLLERGYSRFRIADAAKLAKVSRGGQTHHFATKNDLIEAAIESVFESEVAQAQARALQSDTDIGNSMRESAKHIEDFLMSDLYKVSVNMLVSAGAHEELDERIRSISSRSRGPIETAWIDKLVETGINRNDAEDALWLLWAVQRGIAVQELVGGDAGGTDDITDFTVEMLDEELRLAD